MDQPARSVLHIGGAKTGSTTIQASVLSHFASIHHFGEFGDGITTLPEETLVRSLLEADDQYYNEALVQELFQRHLQESAGRTFVFSSADVFLACRPQQAASRLLGLMQETPRVLLVVRNQISAIESYYSSHGAWLKPAPRPYFRAFVPFNEWFSFEEGVPYASVKRAFDYWGQLMPFVDRVGVERTTVVAFEDLVTGSISAWERVSDCLGVDSKEAWGSFRRHHRRDRVTRGQLAFGRLAGFMLPWVSTPDVRTLSGPLGNRLRRGGKFMPKWSQRQLELLFDWFSVGNCALDQAFGLDLGRHGYPGTC